MGLTWENFPISVKQFILENYLDYESRCSLKLCSKADKLIVDSTKYLPKLITIGEQNVLGKNSIIYLRYESLILELREEKNGITEVFLKSENNEKIAEFTKNQREVAKDWMDRISKNGRIKTRKMRILNLTLPPCPSWSLQCDDLEIRMIGEKRVQEWLQITVPKLKKLAIQEWEISENLMEMPHFKNTSEVLNVSRDVSITDEQLERISAPTIKIFTDWKITEKGVKEAFKKYVENSRFGDHFELTFSISGANFNHSELFQKEWIVEKTGKFDDTDVLKHYRINGGFRNVHGVKMIPNVITLNFSNHMSLKAYHTMDGPKPPTFY